MTLAAFLALSMAGKVAAWGLGVIAVGVLAAFLWALLMDPYPESGLRRGRGRERERFPRG